MGCGAHKFGFLSRRDWMMVARQFTAWDAFEKEPSRRVRCDRLAGCVLFALGGGRPGRRKIKPFPAGRIRSWDAYQAINCLATIIPSLRDKGYVPHVNTQGYLAEPDL